MDKEWLRKVLSDLPAGGMGAPAVYLPGGYQAEGSESFIRRVEGQNGAHVLEAAEQIGLGSRSYELVNIDA